MRSTLTLTAAFIRENPMAKFSSWFHRSPSTIPRKDLNEIARSPASFYDSATNDLLI